MKKMIQIYDTVYLTEWVSGLHVNLDVKLIRESEKLLDTDSLQSLKREYKEVEDNSFGSTNEDTITMHRAVAVVHRTRYETDDEYSTRINKKSEEFELYLKLKKKYDK